MRITSVSFILIGATIFFGHWSLVQFDYVFEGLSSVYAVNTASIPLSIETNNEQIATTSSDAVMATSSKVIDDQASTTTLEIDETIATSTEVVLSFVFPKKDSNLYIGCTYDISWQPTAIVDSMSLVLVDAGTGKISGPVASGLAKESKIETDAQNLKWKVGVVWPGRYYVKASKINNVETLFKSKIFEINKISANMSASERENICKESGATL